ncbi:MAG: alcohol dehydrogenase catalytic domain-containing protein [Vicinamibacterales bacterium]
MCSYGDEHDNGALFEHDGVDHGARDLSVSRREMLAVLGGSAAALVSTGSVRAAQAPVQAAAVAAPPTESGKMTGTKFRALVRITGGANGPVLALETVTMQPIHPLQIVLRMTAAQTCYTTTAALATNATPVLQQAAVAAVTGGGRGAVVPTTPTLIPPAAAPAGGRGAAPAAPAAGGRGGAAAPPPIAAAVTGHGGVGIVEQVGSMVKRVRPGDLVIMSIQAHCGTCATCLVGRADLCRGLVGRIAAPTGRLSDGTPVTMVGNGFSEFLVAWEEAAIPVWTTVPAAELSLLACVTSTGLGMAMCRIPVDPGSDVIVMGLGPVGMSALQGARIQGARRIVGVDPIRYRRDLAMKLGATAVVDPNAEGANLQTTLRNMVGDEAVGRQSVGQNGAGANFVLEAVGGTRFKPTVEAPTDLTGVQALANAYAVVGNPGVIRTCGIAYPGGSMLQIPAGAFSNGSITHAPGNFAGVQPLRDIPRFVKLAERGVLDLKSMVGVTMGPDKFKDALQVAADRSAITSVVVA